MTLPAARWGKVPGIVLVHGSGPHDRDETVGGHKPFRDLAWGLAERGIAVLRYDKRTKVHAAKLAGIEGFTVHHETVEDAGHALRRLREADRVDAKRVFVLGHSLGGTLAPRVAKSDAQLAGVIILAGGTQRLEDAIVQQMQYLSRLDGKISPAEEAQLAAVEKQVARLRALQPADKTAAAPILGAPPSYWLDLRDYDAIATAKTLRRPLLILHGGRDYQVTQEDFDGWKTGLAGVPDVTFKLYPDLNHLFVAGQGLSTPAEYEQTGRVAESAIAEIAAWVRGVTPAP